MAPVLGVVAGSAQQRNQAERAAAQFSGRFAVPIYLSAALIGATRLPAATPVQDKGFLTALTAVEIVGAPAGEIAIHSAMGDGTMVVGDALINFEPYGFALLPAKYCSNFKVMRAPVTAAKGVWRFRARNTFPWRRNREAERCATDSGLSTFFGDD